MSSKRQTPPSIASHSITSSLRDSAEMEVVSGSGHPAPLDDPKGGMPVACKSRLSASGHV